MMEIELSLRETESEDFITTRHASEEMLTGGVFHTEMKRQ